MAAFQRKDLMQRATDQAALQSRIDGRMAEFDTRHVLRRPARFNSADRSPQGRKRVHARADHAPLLELASHWSSKDRTNDRAICS
jgi:hypothetical protein